DTLDQADESAVVISKCGRARQQRNVRIRIELALDAGDPGGGGVAVDQLVLLQRAAAERMALVAKHDSRTAMRRAARGGKARRPAADDEHVAVRGLLLIAIGVALGGGAARSGGATGEVAV